MTSTDQHLDADELAGIVWRKSRHSGSGGNGGSCVDVGPVTDGTGRVAIRHSQHADGPVIVYTRTEWEAFTAGVRDGEFDF
jgi:hypothetical protein